MENKNIENNVQMDTYDKIFPGVGNGGLFSESGLDEMQKAVSREEGFKLFRTFFWVIYLFSALMLMAASALESVPFTAISAGLMALCTVFYLIYAAKISSKGALNRKFAESMSKKYVMISGIFVLAVWLFIFLVKKSTEVEVVAIWSNTAVMYIGNYFCSKRNMKVLEKMLNDDSAGE
ncbi:MAG: hypothetical protein K2H90_02000 [Oscillospiraceae bacterium]|nr:hypothetical protein [Oscillospiraceae bacterium]